MICSNCGAANPADALFCSNCGTRLDGAAAPLYGSTAAPVSPVAPVYTQAPDPASAPYAKPATAYGGSVTPKEGDAGKNWASVMALVFAILSLPCCLFPFFGILFSIAAVVFSVIGLKSQYRGLSIGAMVVAIIGVLVNLFMLIAVLATMATPEFSQAMDEVLSTMEL